MSWMRFNHYLCKYWRLQGIVIILGFITLPLSLLNPYLTKIIVDKAYANKDLKLFLILAILGGGIFVLNGIINSFSGYLSQRLRRDVHFDIAKDIFRHLQNLPLSFFNHRATGEHVYRIIGDVNSVSNFVCNVIPQMLTLFPRALFILLIVFFLNWKLALLATLLIPLNYIQPYFFGKYLRDTMRRLIERLQTVWIRLHETFSHIHLVKAMGKEDTEINRFEENLKRSIEAELQNEKVSSIWSFASSVVNKVIGGIIALYGGYQIIKGTMSLGSLTAVMIYLTQLLGLSKSIGGFYENIIINSISSQRLAEIMDTQPLIVNAQDAIDYQILQGSIEFKNISFGHKENEFILRNLSFSIEPGAKIALVGPSGYGKTTLLALILRLYEPENGTILIDGRDIRKMKLKSLKQQIGIALQEEFLWNDTIKNNMLYTNESASMDEVIRAARIAQTHDFIIKLPKGYDTAIGENACKISEGEKQRIAIARAIIKRPKILILDEAMSSLDSETEDKIIDTLKGEFKYSTMAIVSHRLSTIKKMDLIYFLESPSSIKIGTHERLLKENPAYKELFASQIELSMEKNYEFKA